MSVSSSHSSFRLSFIDLLDILILLINYSAQFSFITLRQSEAAAGIAVALLTVIIQKTTVIQSMERLTMSCWLDIDNIDA